MDSGATNHILPDEPAKFPISYFRWRHGLVRTAGGHSLGIKGSGYSRIMQDRAYIVPKIDSALRSTPQDARSGRYTVFGPEGALITSKPPIIRGPILGTGSLHGNRFILDPEYPSRARQIIELMQSPATSIGPSPGEEETNHNTGMVNAAQMSSEHSPVKEHSASDHKNGIRALAAHLKDTAFYFVHGIFGHLGRRLINAMVDHQTVLGLPKTRFQRPAFACPGCMLGNFRATAVARREVNRPQAPYFPISIYAPLEWVSYDIFEGSRYHSSLEGNRYGVLIRDRGTQMLWSYFFRLKTGLEKQAFPAFLQQIKQDGVAPLQALSADSENVNWSPNLMSIVRSHFEHVRMIPTPPGRPEYNGIIESPMGVWTGRTRASMASAPWMPKCTWQSAAQFTTDVMNISATWQRQDKVPLQRYMPNVSIDISRLRPWGTPCWFNVSKTDIGKADMPRFTNRGHLGFIVNAVDFGRAGYIVYDPYRKRYYHRVDVRLDAAAPWRKPTPIQLIRAMQRNPSYYNQPAPPDIEPPIIEPPILPTSSPASTSSPAAFGGPSPSMTPSSPFERQQTKEEKQENPVKKAARGRPKAVVKIAGRRRPQKKRPPPLTASSRRYGKKVKIVKIVGPEELARMANAEDFEMKEELEELQRIQRQMARLAKEEITLEELERQLNSQVTANAAEADSSLPPTPNNWTEAFAGSHAKEWTAAKKKEETGLDTHGTWEMKPEYKGRTVKSRWAFRVSREQDGSLKFRARLVAKGFSERKGIDYFETFAPTVSLKALLILLHLAASKDWEIRSIDVGNAYLEADLDTEIYMELPPEPGQPRRVVRLLKSIYGLKQAGDLWNKKLDGILRSLGFVRCESDACVYVRIRGTTRTYIALYVDDLLTMSNNRQDLLDFETELAQHVQRLTLKGDAQGYVGLEFKRDREARTITLTQEQYIKDLVHSEGLDFANTKPTPAATTIDLNKSTRDTMNPMRTLVGKIRYAVDHVHPEGLFIASQLSSAVANPGEDHWKVATHTVKYLKGAAGVGLTLGGPSSIEPEIYVDASYIEDGDARSQLGYCMRLNKVAGMVHSRSIRDSSTSLSAAEAELRALKEATQEALWLRYYLRELGFPPAGPMPVHEDNAAVINLIATLKSCPRTRHLNKTRHFIIQQVQKGRIAVKKIAGEFNIADILTKVLEKTRFLMLRAMILGEGLRYKDK